MEIISKLSQLSVFHLQTSLIFKVGETTFWSHHLTKRIDILSRISSFWLKDHSIYLLLGSCLYCKVLNCSFSREFYAFVAQFSRIQSSHVTSSRSLSRRRQRFETRCGSSPSRSFGLHMALAFFMKAAIALVFCWALLHLLLISKKGETSVLPTFDIQFSPKKEGSLF